jgi:exodeoxyribonuclease-1
MSMKTCTAASSARATAARWRSCAAWAATRWPGKFGKRGPAFDDARLEELFFRYRARNWPATLDAPSRPAGCSTARSACTTAWAAARRWRSSLERIDALSETADERGEAILSALYDHAEAIAPELP